MPREKSTTVRRVKLRALPGGRPLTSEDFRRAETANARAFLRRMVETSEGELRAKYKRIGDWSSELFRAKLVNFKVHLEKIRRGIITDPELSLILEERKAIEGR